MCSGNYQTECVPVFRCVPVFLRTETEQLDRNRKASEEMNTKREEINKKLSNVVTKDDGILREMIRDIFQQTKDEFLQCLIE